MSQKPENHMSGQPIAELKNMGQWTRNIPVVCTEVAYIYPYFNKSKHVLCATVNPRNNLAHCFSCSENFNNIDLMMIQGHDFLPAVEILKAWLAEYQRDLGRRDASAQSAAN